MERLTHERANGIKSGYWSPSKKQDLIDRLAEYEDTGLTPDQIREIDRLYSEKCREVAELQKAAEYDRWIPVEERLPDEYGKYTVTAVENGIRHVTRMDYRARTKTWEKAGTRTYWKVIAWRQREKPYRPEGEYD